MFTLFKTISLIVDLLGVYFIKCNGLDTFLFNLKLKMQV